MATNKRNNSRQQKNTGDFNFVIDHVREFDDGNVAFNIQLGRCMIYGCRIVSGKKGEFISFPQRCVPAKKKGEADRYYSNARIIDLTEEEQAEIINAVYEKLDSDD